MKIIDQHTACHLPSCVATIGFFDGVHKGHRFLIRQVQDIAAVQNLASMLITFPVHPRQVMQSNYCPQLLSCPAQKLELLSGTGVDYCALLPFTHELSEYSAYRFMQLLHETFHVKTLLIGYDHRFGYNRSEGFEDYCRYGKELGMEVLPASAYTENGLSVSSSSIRKLLLEGNVSTAAQCLGYAYYIDGTVTGGFRVGRTIGFPTANIQPSCSEKLIPAHGVYAVTVSVKEKNYAGMLNIGNRPTLQNGNNTSIEVHILNFSEDIYQEKMRIFFHHYIRPEKKFNNLQELTQQLEADKTTVLQLLAK